MELTVENLVKQYPKKRALDDVSFTLTQGIYGLLGPNGAGKTTLVNIIAGILRPTSGQVLWDGEDIDALDWRYREILGFQPQTPSLYKSFRAEEFLRYMAAVKGMKLSHRELDATVDRLLDTVNLREDSRRRIGEFSGGMRQRVMIAMGLICHPQLLIADEPTTALDVTIQAQILELMKDLQKKTHMGIIFITHNLGVVAEICDKVSVMYAGKMVEQGPVDDIFYKPGHPYTMGLLRSMPRVDAESYERLIPIEGTPVDMLNPPEGCPFAPRCEHAMKICLQKMPPYIELGENHRAACWLRVQDQLQGKKQDAAEQKEVGDHE